MESSRHAVAREGWLTAAGERAGGRYEGEGERFEARGVRHEARAMRSAAAGRRERHVATERFSDDARGALSEREAQSLAAVILACLEHDREVALQSPAEGADTELRANVRGQHEIHPVSRSERARRQRIDTVAFIVVLESRALASLGLP